MERRWSARPARFLRQPCASWPRSDSKRLASVGRLFRRLFQRRDPGQDDLDARTSARFGIEVEPATQTVSHDTVDDVQSQPGAAVIAARREKRVERAAPDVERHPATIVGKNDFKIILAGLPDPDIDRALLAVRKSMRHRVEEQIG